MNTITRRTALAAPVTLPLLPMASYAQPTNATDAAWSAYEAAWARYDADKAARDFVTSALKAPPFIRLMAETLHADEARMRTILCDLGPDGLEAAKLATDYMALHGKMMAVAEGMKAAAVRIVMALEQMEADGEIVTTDAILEPLNAFYDAMEKARTDAAETAATKKPDDAA